MTTEHDARIAADARRPYALSQQANINKLNQLILDATEKYHEAYVANGGKSDKNAAYWAGMADGLKRALNVIEGRG